jgi:CPA2 family monovalent cation:H+ antiporter-2
MEDFLFQASIYLAAAVIAVPLASRLGLGSVLGYLCAGILIGPVFGLVGAEAENIMHFAELGVVVMLFLIGLELDPRALWDMRHRLLGLGGLQILGTTALITAGAMAFGLAPQTALATGLIFSLSSTAIVLQTLTEKRLMETSGGRSTFSVLLMQDIAVIPMLALLPFLAFGLPAQLRPDGSISRGAIDADTSSHGLSFVDGLPAWGVTAVTLGAVAFVILLGIFAARPLFRFIHTARLREMYTAFALLIVVGIAFIMQSVGLSPALGTFMAGVLLANSEFRHELESDLEPFKGLLLGLFFIAVGAGIQFSIFFADPIGIFGMAMGVMIAKGLVLFAIAILFRIRGRARWLFTLGLAQAGEFGFVLISFATQLNVLTGGYAQVLLLVTSLSMLLTPLFFILYERLSARIGDAHRTVPADKIDEQQPIILAGVGRFGQAVNRLTLMAGLKATVIDNDLKRIQLMRRFGAKGFFGEPTRPELLKAAGIETARVLVIALDDRKASIRLIHIARRFNPDIHIIARAYDSVHAFELRRAGANDIVREMFDSSIRAGRYVLENMGFTDFEAANLSQIFFKRDRAAVLELGELWDPSMPVSQNEAYSKRSKELNAELETELMAVLEERAKDAPAAE